MSKPFKPRRGTTAQLASFIGEAHEVTFDTDKHTLVAHDGVTAGGFPLTKEADLTSFKATQAAKDAEQDVAISSAQQSVTTLDATLRALIAAEVAKCLKTSGGTITGELVLDGLCKKSTDNSFMVIFGGSDWNNGAYLQLTGSANPDEQSTFALVSRYNGTHKEFKGTPDGALVWAGQAIERVNASGVGFIRYESGLQICYGDVSPTRNGSLVTYPAAFSTPWVRIVLTLSCGTGAESNFAAKHYSAGSLQTTGFTAYASDSFYANYIAIGPWK